MAWHPTHVLLYKMVFFGQNAKCSFEWKIIVKLRRILYQRVWLFSESKNYENLWPIEFSTFVTQKVFLSFHINFMIISISTLWVLWMVEKQVLYFSIFSSYSNISVCWVQQLEVGPGWYKLFNQLFLCWNDFYFQCFTFIILRIRKQ